MIGALGTALLGGAPLGSSVGALVPIDLSAVSILCQVGDFRDFTDINIQESKLVTDNRDYRSTL